jgi:hypothetical protein
MSGDAIFVGGVSRLAAAGICMLLIGCGATGGSGGRSSGRRAAAPGSSRYSVLERPGSNGISVIDPSEVSASRSTPSHPIWISLPPPPRKGGGVRPVIRSARELMHAGSLRIWLARNTNGGICMLSFDPREAPDPEHDHSLLVFCGNESTLGHGAVIVEPWAHGDYLAVGAVPDGVRFATLVLVDGARRRVVVKNNSYHAVVRSQLGEVTFPGQT